MSQNINDYKLSQLTFQIERLSLAIDKVCNRIDNLEKESFQKEVYKKFISLLYFIYPGVMAVLLVFNGVDRKKISEVYNQTQAIIGSVNDPLTSYH